MDSDEHVGLHSNVLRLSTTFRPSIIRRESLDCEPVRKIFWTCKTHGHSHKHNRSTQTSCACKAPAGHAHLEAYWIQMNMLASTRLTTTFRPFMIRRESLDCEPVRKIFWTCKTHGHSDKHNRSIQSSCACKAPAGCAHLEAYWIQMNMLASTPMCFALVRPSVHS